MAQSIYTVTYNQSLEDLCTIIYGNLDFMGQLMIDNVLPISDYVTLGTNVLYDSSFTPNPNRITTGILGGSYCGIITNLTISFVSATSVTIGWSAVPGASNYIYQLNTTGIPPTIFTGTTVGTNIVTLTGLIANTNYFLFIATKCTNGSFSNWTIAEFDNNYFLITDVYYTTPGYAIGGYVSLY